MFNVDKKIIIGTFVMRNIIENIEHYLIIN